jgi:hypothetical protein
MQVNPNTGLYDAWAGLSRKVETTNEKARYQQWYGDMIETAADSSLRQSLWSAFGMFNPAIGLIGQSIDAARTVQRMPDQFELDPENMYADPNVVSDYASGSAEALYELENSLYTGLGKQVGNIILNYGSAWDEDQYGEDQWQWGWQVGPRKGKMI